MLQGHGPQLRSNLLGPAHLGVEHHGSGHGYSSSNHSFSHCVLVMSTNSTEGNLLIQFSQFFVEFLGGEDTIVSVVDSPTPVGAELRRIEPLLSEGGYIKLVPI